MSPRKANSAKSLHDRVCEACAAVGVVPKRGKNTTKDYPYQKAAHVAAAFRLELFNRKIRITQDEQKVEYVEIPTNGGGTITECRLEVKFALTDGKETIGPETHHGAGRDDDGKALYKAQTGALKYYLRGLGLIPDETDDPEADGEAGETLDDVAPPRPSTRKKERPLAPYQIAAIEEAIKATEKRPEELAQMVCARGAATLAEVQQKHFRDLLKWASDGKGTLGMREPADPKPQAAPAAQTQLPLRAAQPDPNPLRIGNKTIEMPARKDAFAL